MRIVQFVQQHGRRAVGVVDGDDVINLTETYPQYETTLALALDAIERTMQLNDMLLQLLPECETRISYEALWNGEPGSDLHLLPPLDHHEASCTHITGTGLTHTGSMQSRDQMHAQQDSDHTVESEADEPQLQTDSAKMFQLGLEGGKPQNGQRGTAPEWFYKGNGVCLRGHRDLLDIPSFALDGGEEPEFVGCYVIARDGTPYRVGFALGNEWSDHATEKINYLYLAPSKIRTCSVGPELVVGESFDDLDVRVMVTREAKIIYDSGDLKSGQQFMCHSLENCEDHHFKYPLHRQPGDVHLHYFGTSKLSYGQRDWKFQAEDVIEVFAEGFSRSLINRVQQSCPEAAEPVKVKSL
ncbi:MAG: sugar transporter [Planctomycetaceae bacterium]|nr:sugar transporter [Planctomycetaceae bacterium]|tara:strand:- start:498 stop:1562 length:1065 start_codon:yes stop_codon:yes gene_type:complete